jgi:hypothetical protein
MNESMNMLGRALRGALGLVFGLALLVFAMSLLLAALLVVAGMSLWALLTGRKPAPVMMFQRFRQQSQRFTGSMNGGMAGGMWPGRSGPASHGTDVVDVQAHVVPDAPAPGAEPMRRVWP